MVFFIALNGLVDWDLKFHCFKDILIATLKVEITFVGPNHVASGAKTVLSIKPQMIGTFYLMKLKAFLTF